ncbi:hypothetical protein ACH5RR_029683 [Cinchona calisaya]|uniref:Glutamate decarboxylase n=1 Tax=Cinchona calisaya TaxID=153742 RepID=A0ABD2YSE6_9GENT
MENAKLLQHNLKQTGHFDIISKEKGLPLVAFTFKDKNKSLAFELSKALRHHGWIVPAYTMPANVEHIAVLRVVVREDLGRQLIEKLFSHISSALFELSETTNSVPKILLTVEVKVGNDHDKGSLHLPTTSIHLKQDKYDRDRKKVHEVGGKTKGAC